jgi:adenosylmethionine-8-amino-7-oxononanoate aminotransferase
MSVCDLEGGMHRIWDGVLPRQVFAGIPSAGFAAGVDTPYAERLRSLVAAHAHELAAVIVEPVVQGAGGMRFHDPGHAGVSPDVMCLGKALTGGYLSLAATLCTPQVAAGICRGEPPVLAHGPTFMGNPLACAVANASLDLLLGEGPEPGYPRGWQVEVSRIEVGLTAELAAARELSGVADVRVLGAIGVVQLGHQVDVARAAAAAVAAGVWLRPFRDLIYTMPPYVSCDGDLALICAGVLAAVQAG